MSNEKKPTKRISVLQETNIGTSEEFYGHVILPDENILCEFKGGRDAFIMTNRKVILVDIQGLTGKKKEVLVIPYSKISAFSTETGGMLDLDAELKIWASGINYIELNFVKNAVDMRNVAQILSTYIG